MYKLDILVIACPIGMSAIFKICVLYGCLAVAYSYTCNAVDSFRGPGDPVSLMYNPNFPLPEDCKISSCFWNYYSKTNDSLKLNCTVVEFTDGSYIRHYLRNDTVPDENFTRPFVVEETHLVVALRSKRGCYDGRFYCTLEPPGGAPPKEKCDCKENETNKFPSLASLVFNYKEEVEGKVLIVASRLAITTADLLQGKKAQSYTLLAGGYNFTELDRRTKFQVLKFISAFIIHDKYEPGKNLNNFGMIILLDELIFEPKIQRACLLSSFKRNLPAVLEEPDRKKQGLLDISKGVVLLPIDCQRRYGSDFSNKQHLCVRWTKCENTSSPLFYSRRGMSYGVGLITHNSNNCGNLKAEIAMDISYFIETMVKTIYPEAELCVSKPDFWSSEPLG